ncbi:MAG: hypothetical protein AAF682_31915 [Planctomycetota bacterium]
MILWEVMNTSSFVGLMSLVRGSLVAAKLASVYQRRAHLHQLRLRQAQDILGTYPEYIRLAKGDTGSLAGPDFDALHARIVVQAKICLAAFASKWIAEGWRDVARRLASLRDRRLNDRDAPLDEALREVADRTNASMGAMFRGARVTAGV